MARTQEQITAREQAERRSRVLGVYASHIAAGLMANPETSGQDRRRIARWAVEIAEAILELTEPEREP